MQNIPSHATDIRHMFRATPEEVVKVDAHKSVDSNSIVVQLPNWYLLQDSITSAYVPANTIECSQKINLLHNDEVESHQVLSIKESDNGTDLLFELSL